MAVAEAITDMWLVLREVEVAKAKATVLLVQLGRAISCRIFTMSRRSPARVLLAMPSLRLPAVARATQSCRRLLRLWLFMATTLRL